ncbi:hypothetical protein PGT21_027257 [Puccinia graminis f. sp. tritici]|uniref:Uncharacterized protein n=1 Tax=Puccinia graminis f. sp. tritici TaxID=56615 RepID=A0A5B0NDC6_PUCGR|nr:hypothetical protein PGT21_027257 [Puccinia graminis f. sp. tritici]
MSPTTIDPTLMELSPTTVFESFTPSSHSSPIQTRSKPQRKRRTKAQMIAARMAEKSQHKAATRKSNKLTQTPGESTTKFSIQDYENICSYLEDPGHYNQLFGNGPQTSVGPAKLTKTSAFAVFAIYMNNSNPQLSLTGRQLQQRFATYKSKYVKAKRVESGTGAGIVAGDTRPLTQVLESMCPCYLRMDAIFGSKANVEPMYQYDSTISNRLEVDSDGPRSEITDSDSSNNPFSNSEGQPHPKNMPGRPSRANFPPTLSSTLLANSLGMENSPAYGHIHSSLELPDSAQPELDSPVGNQHESSNINHHNRRRIQASHSKGNTTLAMAFDRSTEKKFEYLSQQMDWEKERFERETQRDQQKQQQEHQHEKDKQSVRINAAQKWVEEGKLPSEIETLMKATFGT